MKKIFRSKKFIILLTLGLLTAGLIWKIFLLSVGPLSATSPPAMITTINDASRLNQTPIFGIITVQSETDIRNALQLAREKKIKVSISGKRHSMGGQSLQKNGIVLDMTSFNQIHLDKEKKVLTAQSGATWAQIQQLLDKDGLSVKAMQSINIFTLGGSLSVNAHGIDHNPGPIASTVRSFRIMLANGEIKTVSSTENRELFSLALGGYGLFGVILDITLDLTENVAYDRKTIHLNYKDFPEYFKAKIAANENVGLFYGRLSISPASFLTETAIHTYEKYELKLKVPPLKPEKHVGFQRFIFNFSKTGSFGRWIRWTLEKYLEPRTHTYISGHLVSRNQEMFDSMGYLQNRLKSTDILQEYFLPIEKMPEFVDGLRSTVQKNHANLLNVTIRFVHKDTITALPYAKGDWLAFVLYFNRKPTKEDEETLRKTIVELTALTVYLKGTFYLPYQLYYSPGQLRSAYPEIDSFFDAKRRFDPTELFSNTFYEKYGRKKDFNQNP